MAIRGWGDAASITIVPGSMSRTVQIIGTGGSNGYVNYIVASTSGTFTGLNIQFIGGYLYPFGGTGIDFYSNSNTFASGSITFQSNSGAGSGITGCNVGIYIYA